MLSLYFQGWFQCRLATNPDPTDEPRGVSGYTFAVAGEPDLDRIIRLHNPVAPRSHGPPIGVFVSLVMIDGEPIADHYLTGASVELLDEPKFESRNLLLTDDKAGTGLIHPFHIRCCQADVSIDRLDVLCPPEPERPIYELPPEILNRRAPIHRDGFRIDPAAVRNATGIADPFAYRHRRKNLLETDLASSGDPATQAALKLRISELSESNPRDPRLLMMQAVQTRRFNIRGPAEWHDPDLALGVEIDAEAEWPVEMWMGAWDADALSGYLNGALHIATAS